VDLDSSPLPDAVEDLALRHRKYLIGVNIAGAAFGFYYYTPQLNLVPTHLWLLVADSPIATLLFAAALGSTLIGSGSRLLSSIAFVANLKYGIWTAAVLLIFSDGFLSSTSIPMYLFLLLSHLGMAAQVFLLDRVSDFSKKGLVAGAAFYAVNDIADYTSVLVRPLHPLLPEQEAAAGAYTHMAAHSPAGAAAVMCTLVSVALLAVRIKE
jgi:uncharacterized membrane protein YpjA